MTSRLREVAVRGIAALTLAVGLTAAVAGAAQAETRSLKLYFVHTGERATITFKRNGKFDADGLAKLNRFLRDWRRNEPTKMDPRLFDLIWSVYQKSGSSDYINVLCGYRSPGTNELLRNRSRHTGVAKESQHILGKAMDFYIPGVPLERLREIGLKLQMGGVGYYPTSGSPFVHMDVGGVRAWPRASRETLVRLFPDGKTIHLPTDGKPLPGYQAAMADYKRRMGSDTVEIASSGGGRKNLFQMLFGGGDEDESPEAITDNAPPKAQPPKAAPPAAPPVQVASAEPEPQPKQTFIENIPSTTVANAPVPNVRPSVVGGQGADLETALVSPARSSATDAMASVLQPPAAGNGDYADLGDYKIPVPQLLGDRRQPGEADLAAVPLPGTRPDFQVASVAPDASVAPLPTALPPQTADAGGNAPKPASGSDEIAAMIRRMSGEDASAAPAAPVPAGKPQQVALAEPPATANKQLTRSLKADIRPALAEQAYQPKKGARPNKTDAIAALRGSHSQPSQLTGEMIEKWALAANNAQIVAPKPADGVNRRDADADARAANVASSENRPATFDPARFSGAAPVARPQ
ncbi:DUF882 domain-containing protein [Rhizobium sp. C4]|uniref:DUF882 domain-containing protein n=1 Tax=Rhizobium sp. C4 TaxID=1349800 RepID=UPI001E38F26C|nr:DUF882 domain-containing protein [Rhizobium sp. C4]MCD2174091.1 DUF882 domain-containing protein [Rhizobium sp. C4]